MLCESIQTGDTNYLRQYLLSGGDANQLVQYKSGSKFRAPLVTLSLKEQRVDLLDFFLANGANPNQVDFLGDTPLIWAIRAGENQTLSLKAIELLLKAGGEPNRRSLSDYRWTPLMWAAVLRRERILNALIEAEADVNATNTIGQTALHLAGNAKVASILLAAGADTTLRATNGMSAVEMAIWERHFDVLNVLTNSLWETNR